MLKKIKRFWYNFSHPIIGEVWQLHRVRDNLSSDGSTLKLISDSRYPKDLTLKDIYSPAYADILNIVNNTCVQAGALIST